MAQPGHPLLEDHIAATTLKLEQPSARQEEGNPKTSSENTFPARVLAAALRKWKQMDGGFDNERGNQLEIKKKAHPEPDPKRMSLTVKSQTHNVPLKRLLTYQPGTERVPSEVSPPLPSARHRSLASKPERSAP